MTGNDPLLLEECLRFVEAGTPPGEALAAVPLGEQARLAPLLAVALNLRETPLAPLRPAFRAGLQARLAEMESATTSWPELGQRPRAWGRWVGVATALLLVALCSFSIALAAGLSVPGDRLYPMKKGVERLVTARTPPEAQQELDRRLAAERLREAGVLLARGADRTEVVAALEAARELLAPSLAEQAADGGSPLAVPRRRPPSRPPTLVASGAVPTPGPAAIATPRAVPRIDAGATASAAAQRRTLVAAGATATTTSTLTVPSSSTAETAIDTPRRKSDPTPHQTPAWTPTPRPSSPGVRIEGVVLRGGLAVEGALVSAWLVAPGQLCADDVEPAVRVTTNGEGFYSIEGLATGTYQVSAEGGPSCLPRRWFVGASEMATSDPCAPGSRVIELPLPGDRLQLANLLFDASAGECPMRSQ